MRLLPLALTLLAVTILLPAASFATPPTPSADQRPSGLMVTATETGCPTAPDFTRLCALTTRGVLRDIGHGIEGVDPSWSPGRHAIAFESAEGGGIWRVQADGTRRRRLTLNPKARTDAVHFGDFAPAWSPGGRRIAFVRVLGTVEAKDVAIWLVRADGRGKARRLAAGAQPDWSPDGKRIVFIRKGGGPQVIDADGRHRHVLQRADPDAAIPQWSPDGRRIAYVNVPDAGAMEVRVLDLVSGSEQTLVQAETISDLAWSADGRWLAYVIETDEEQVDGLCPSCHSDLWLHRVADGHREVIFSEGLNFYGFDW